MVGRTHNSYALRRWRPTQVPSSHSMISAKALKVGRSECDNQFHDNNELVVALSTGWYDGGSRCGRMIVISASSAATGRSMAVKVVDECDSEHVGLPPSGNNVVDGTLQVDWWRFLWVVALF
ncbi:hypothetical protein L3X38_031428 [Prunus dulcis]|uniref:Ripening-related protein grip22 n=1 Tax=Prunus dulcis TaxID=3755 RepID=A0AAD4YV01_PRUDU|nr:hypothetical protein L3X38_031428 [Prunus dulcis]